MNADFYKNYFRVFKFIIKIKYKTAVAIGVFDGMHIGHRSVISILVKSSYMPVVFTIDMRNRVAESKVNFSFLSSSNEKFYMLKKLGVKVVLSVPYENIKNLDYVQFFEDILIKKLNAKLIVCGKNLKFGKDNKGDVLKLKLLAKKHSVNVKVLDLLDVCGGHASSSRARLALKAGNLPLLNRILGRNFSISFKILNFNYYNNFIVFRNVLGVNFTVPRSGLYITSALICGNLYPSVSCVERCDRLNVIKVYMRSFFKFNIKGEFLRLIFLKYLN